MTTIASKVIAAFLGGEGYSVYPGSVWPDGQDVSAIVKDAPGGGDTPTYGGSPSWRQAGVQVLVRGSARDPDEARNRAHEIYDALKWTSPPGTKAVRPQGGGPIDVTGDDDSRPVWSINFIVEIYE